MGNYLSCTLATASGARGGARVVFPTGEIRRFDSPVNAAELMLDAPNHFLVNASSMHIGRRFSAMAADEELEMGGVYVLFQMKRVNSVVTAADMGVLLAAASSARRRAAVRVIPEAVAPEGEAEVEEKPRVRLEEVEGGSLGEMRYRTSLCRSRKPMLETIAEESSIICSR